MEHAILYHDDGSAERVSLQRGGETPTRAQFLALRAQQTGSTVRKLANGRIEITEAPGRPRATRATPSRPARAVDKHELATMKAKLQSLRAGRAV